MKDTKNRWVALKDVLRPFKPNESRKTELKIQANWWHISSLFGARRRLTQCVSSVTSFWSQQISQYWLADRISKGSRLFGVTSSSWGHLQSRQRFDKLCLLAISEAILNFRRDSSWSLTHNNKIDTSEVHGTVDQNEVYHECMLSWSEQ